MARLRKATPLPSPPHLLDQRQTVGGEGRTIDQTARQHAGEGGPFLHDQRLGRERHRLEAIDGQGEAAQPLGQDVCPVRVR